MSGSSSIKKDNSKKCSVTFVPCKENVLDGKFVVSRTDVTKCSTKKSKEKKRENKRPSKIG